MRKYGQNDRNLLQVLVHADNDCEDESVEDTSPELVEMNSSTLELAREVLVKLMCCTLMCVEIRV